jgi:DNA-binding CsgD family transcriptional regulator
MAYIDANQRFSADSRVGGRDASARRREVAWAGLSRTERRIVELVGEALTNRQIGRELFLSPHTINYYLRGIFRRFGIHSRVELACIAHDVGSTSTTPRADAIR